MEKIVAKIQEVFCDMAPSVAKQWDTYNSVFSAAYGYWYYYSSNGKLYLGKTEDAALETLDTFAME